MSDFVGRASTDLAMQFLREGKLHECIECANKVLAANPDDALAYSILGAAYSQAGDRGMAIASFQHALAVEQTARAHFNLGKAYEDSRRDRDALEQYKLALAIEPFYRPAADALNRVSKTIPDQPAPAGDAPPPHLLTGEAEPAAAPQADQPPAAPPAPPAPDQQPVPAAPQPATGSDQMAAPAATMAQTQPIPGAPAQPPQPARLPDLRALEARSRTNEAKVKEAQRRMTVAGLGYGVLIGACGYAVLGALLWALGVPASAIFVVVLVGGVLGGIIGLVIGITCGDEMTGAKVGAVIGGVGACITLLPAIGKIPGIVIFVEIMMRAVIMGVVGYFIGMLIERSIGQ